MVSAVTKPATKRVDYSKIVRVALTAAGASAAINAVLFLITSALGAFGPNLITPAGGPLSIGPVIISSIIGVLAGSAVYALFGKIFKSAITIFRVVAIIVLVLSFGNPFIITNATIVDIIILNLMHVVAGVFAIVLLTTRAVKDA
jgi:hypothetical protein